MGVIVMKRFNRNEYLKNIKGQEAEKYTDVTNVIEVWDDDLEFCGCGAPWESLKIIREVLNLVCKRCEEDDFDFKKAIHEFFGCKTEDMSMQVYEILANILNNASVLEHGSNIVWSWLTSYGEEVRESLNRLTDFELENTSEIRDVLAEVVNYENGKKDIFDFSEILKPVYAPECLKLIGDEKNRLSMIFYNDDGTIDKLITECQERGITVDVHDTSLKLTVDDSHGYYVRYDEKYIFITAFVRGTNSNIEINMKEIMKQLIN